MPSGLTYLPDDILLLILPYLEVRDFLALTSADKRLRTLLEEHTFWAAATRSTFRVPNQPVVAKDGPRWHKLYKRLRTQTRAYGWGDNQRNCLGQVFDEDLSPAGVRRRRRQRHIAWPEQMNISDGGIISDMQCGGWSTSVLTSTGVIRVCGVLDGQDIRQDTRSASELTFPSNTSSSDHNADTAIKEYSHGRSHLLALSDSGVIWSWRDAGMAAIKVKFLHHDTERDGKSLVRKVRAGWGTSAALVAGTGIITWQPVGRQYQDTSHPDMVLLIETGIVPSTTNGIANFVVLENMIVFNTDDGIAYMSMIGHNMDMSSPRQICSDVTDVQGSFRNLAVFTKTAVLTTTTERLIQFSTSDHATDPFRRIPALQNSQVITVAFGDYHYHALHAPGYVTSYGNEPESCGAFGLGGYAFPEGRLRGIRHEGMQMPGAVQRNRGDGKLVPHAYIHGRQVWFEKEKREWIKFLTSGGSDAGEAAERMRLAIGSVGVNAQGEVSEWIEQEGREWETKYGVESKDGLPAYFVLSVCAAGWHSGALVLVNQELADEVSHAVEISEGKESSQLAPTSASSFPNSILMILFDILMWFLGAGLYSARPIQSAEGRQQDMEESDRTAWGASPRAGYRYVWADDHFPRLKLSNGEDMPGTTPLNEWRYGQPQWDLDRLVDQGLT